MDHTVFSCAADVTLKARLRGQFAALRFASPPPDTVPKVSLSKHNDYSKIPTRVDAENAPIRADLPVYGRP